MQSVEKRNGEKTFQNEKITVTFFCDTCI